MTEARRRVSPLQSIVGITFVTAVLWFLFSPKSPVNDGATPREGLTQAPGDAAAAPREDMPRVDVPWPRVASTSPAITETLVELGLAAHIVGRSGYCRSVPEAVPVVGDLRDFDAERLAACAPDVLFVQPPLAGVDPALRGFCAEQFIPLVDRRLDTLADLDGLLDDVASAFRTPPDAAGEGLARRLAEAKALVASSPAAATAETPAVVLLVSADPFLAVGRGNYLDELLSRAGLANALPRDGYIELGAEALLALSPATILVATETDAGAARARELLAKVPWPEGRAPRLAARAMPGLLSPSLAAVRRAQELATLAQEAQ
ncbi:MAG: ABC transporter substrate-binding protein [Planctomycetaceae bacterium]|nr:ABC transporter substrate-binding protein [Planctomycetaceae bacterium]